MRAFNRNQKIFCLILAVLFCACARPSRLLADDKDSTAPPAKPASAKPNSPAPLSERERWMLDRMEQLEKRVAELESRSNAPAAPATVAAAAQPVSATAGEPVSAASAITAAAPS